MYLEQAANIVMHIAISTAKHIPDHLHDPENKPFMNTRNPTG